MHNFLIIFLGICLKANSLSVHNVLIYMAFKAFTMVGSIVLVLKWLWYAVVYHTSYVYANYGRGQKKLT